MSLYEKFVGKFLLFCKIIAPKMFYLPFSKAHYDIEKKMLSSHRKLNFILPRGLAKTTLMSQLYPLYHIFVDNPKDEKFVVIVSKTNAHAINCLTAIKNILDYSLEFRAIFGYYGMHTAKIYRENMIVLSNNAVIMAKGMGQPIRGLNYNGIRPTYVVLDDLEDENNTKTNEAMENNLTWVLKGVIPAISNKYGYEKCVSIGTPIHQLCVVEQLAKMSDWLTTRYSYLINDDTESLWPESKSVEELLQEKEALENVGRVSAFYSERMCQIIGDESQLFKEEYFQYHNYQLVIENDEHYLVDDDLPEEKRKIAVNVFMGVDPASSTENNRDYSTIVVLAIDAQDNIYVLDYFRKRVTPLELADTIETWYNKFKPCSTRIESVQYQEMLRLEMKRRMYIPGLEVKEKPTTRKELRLSSLQPRFVQLKVFIKRNMKELKEEFLTFPRSSHDDLMDAYYYAHKACYKPHHQVNKIQPKEPTYNEDYYNIDWELV